MKALIKFRIEQNRIVIISMVVPLESGGGRLVMFHYSYFSFRYNFLFLPFRFYSTFIINPLFYIYYLAVLALVGLFLSESEFTEFSELAELKSVICISFLV